MNDNIKKTAISKAITKLRAAYPTSTCFSDALVPDIALVLSTYETEDVEAGVAEYIRRNRFISLSDLYDTLDNVRDVRVCAERSNALNDLTDEPVCDRCGNLGLVRVYYAHGVQAYPCSCAAGHLRYNFQGDAAKREKEQPIRIRGRIKFSKKEYDDAYGSKLTREAYEARMNGAYLDNGNEAVNAAYEDRMSEEHKANQTTTKENDHGTDEN